MNRLLLLAALSAATIFAQTPAREAWALDRGGTIFRLSGGQWNPMPGILNWISVGADGEVWGVTASEGIYRWVNGGWVLIPGGLSQISVGNAGIVWGVFSGGSIWRRTGDAWAEVPVPKRMLHVSAASDGAVWALDVDSGIWRRNGDTWQAVGGLLRQISVGNAQTIWGVSTGGEVWRFNGAGWDKMPNLVNQVSVSPDGEVWAIMADGQLARWNGSAWVTLGRSFVQVSVGMPAVTGTPGGQKTEENSSAFTFNGAWTPTRDASASGGAYTSSNTAGASVTFSVTGNNFVLYRRVDPAGGYADVTVDGKSFGRLTFYFPETRWQVPAVLDQLGDGRHTIVLTVASAQPRGSRGTNVYFDAVENPAPPSLGPTEAQLTAVARANFYRAKVGIPPARHHLALGLAATAHGKYLTDVDFIGRGSSPHVETFGASPNFSGEQPSDRAALFGFTGAFVGEDANNNPDPNGFVDGWMDGVYHREPFIAYSLTEIGFGAGAVGSAVNFASRVIDPLRPAAPTVYTFPADGQTDVWLNYGGGDGPNNVTRGNLGYPISLQVAYPASATASTGPRVPTTGSLTDAAGNSVPVTIADPATDSELSGFFMIPNQPLAPATTYTARLTGTDALNNRFDKTWRFTTVGTHAVHEVRATLGRNSYIYSINWDMPGSGVASQLEYGPTPAYGNVIQGELFPGRQTTFRAQVAGLLTAPVTHYRVTSRDAQGNLFASPNYTLNVEKPLAPATAGYTTVFPDSNSASIRWETAGPVASTHIEYGVDTNYGKTEPGSAFSGYTTWFIADLSDLNSGTTYHYRLVATDTQGNRIAGPDATFTTQ